MYVSSKVNQSAISEIRAQLPSLIVGDPDADETLEDYIAWHDDDPDNLGRYFSAKELTWLRKWRRRDEPARRLWPNIIRTRHLAGYLRKQMGFPLIVGNGWRSPAYNKAVRGASKSMHMEFAALDLDLPIKHRDKTTMTKFYDEAVKLYVAVGREFNMGLGLYDRRAMGSRVHIDTGRKRIATWTRKGTPSVARVVAARLGLQLPRPG